MNFKNHFSVQAADYAKFRPHYPTELFDYLSDIVPGNEIAWDCATGNGQAAVALASKFRHVIATDASEKQIKNAARHERIDYRVAAAEKSGINSDKIDIITVAQALHWFALDLFYAEAKRVLKPQGVLAVLGYNLLQIAPNIDNVIDRFYEEIVSDLHDLWGEPERVRIIIWPLTIRVGRDDCCH